MKESGLETIVDNEPGTGKVLTHMTRGIAQDLYTKVIALSKKYVLGNLSGDIYEMIDSDPQERYSAYAKEATKFSSEMNIPLYTVVGAIVGFTLGTPAVPLAIGFGLIGAAYGIIEWSFRESVVRKENCPVASLPGWLLSIPVRPMVKTAINLSQRYETAKRELTEQWLNPTLP